MTTEQQLEELRRAATRLLAALEKEASTFLTLQTARENYTNFDSEREHSMRAMLEASAATEALRRLLEKG